MQFVACRHFAVLSLGLLLGCERQSTRLTVTALEGTQPLLVLLTCEVEPAPARPFYRWRLGDLAPLRPAPLDVKALLVLAPPADAPGALVACSAASASGARAWAEELVLPMEVGGVSPSCAAPGAPLVVVGHGFGSQRPSGAADGVWLVPRRGSALRASQDCPGAVWNDRRIVACVPPLDHGSYEVRVERGQRLARLAGQRLSVPPCPPSAGSR